MLEPQISFVPVSGLKATFTYPIDDIVEIKKVRPSFPSMPFPCKGISVVLRSFTRHVKGADATPVTRHDG